LQIQGSYQSGFITKIDLTRPKLSRGLRQRGAYTLPKATKISETGSDIYYAETLPMVGTSKLATDAYGQLAGVPGLHVVGGAVLSQLAAKTLHLQSWLTLTGLSNIWYRSRLLNKSKLVSCSMH
jgi:hypothetical protein